MKIMNPLEEQPKPEVTEDAALENGTYEFDDVEHELPSKYQPKFLAKGSEHIVYEVQGHPDVVVKVAVEPLKRALNWNNLHELPLDALSEEVESGAREYIKQATERYQQLKTSFGSGHVLNQRKFLIKVPITEKILNELYEGHPPGEATEAWAVVMVQKRAMELSDPKHLALVAGYAEEGDVKTEDWNEVTEHLVLGKNAEARLKKDDFLAVQSNTQLKTLLEQAGDHENLKESLKELVEKAISYTQETGEILDIIGEDNVVLSEKDETWSYTLVDALYPYTPKMMDEAKAVMLRLSAGAELREWEQNILMNAFNYVRTINGLAEQLGVQKRINIVPEGMKKEAIDYLSVIRKNLSFIQD